MGSDLARWLSALGYSNLLTAHHAKLVLLDQAVTLALECSTGSPSLAWVPASRPGRRKSAI